jgi:hypothetical protein
VTADDQVKAYIKKIMGQLKEWMYGGKISKLVVVITSKETGEHVERWQFDVGHAKYATSQFLIASRFKFTGRTQRQNLPNKRRIKRILSQSECASWPILTMC